MQLKQTLGELPLEIAAPAGGFLDDVLFIGIWVDLDGKVKIDQTEAMHPYPQEILEIIRAWVKDTTRLHRALAEHSAKDSEGGSEDSEGGPELAREPMDVYLICLTGQGDIEVKIIPAAAAEWLHKPYSKDQEQPPDWLLDSPNWSQEQQMILVGSGSPENDRALQAVSIAPYDECYFSLTEALEAIRRKGDKIAGSYEGVIY